jgi:hypothetical protein
MLLWWIPCSTDYSKEPTCYFGSGLPWFSGDAVGQSLDYHAGIRSNVVELPASEALQLSVLCRAYKKAASTCDRYFVIGWILAVTVSFFFSYKETLTALAVATCIVVWWGVLSKRSLRDRTQDHQFLCRSHVHVYTYFPGDGKTEACYYCVCGNVEKARDDDNPEG